MSRDPVQLYHDDLLERARAHQRLGLTAVDAVTAARQDIEHHRKAPPLRPVAALGPVVRTLMQQLRRGGDHP